MFVTKGTDTSEKFLTGAVRGHQAGKPRYDLIGLHAQRREAELLERGAARYGERNWEKGQNVARTLASLMRHVYAYAEGDREEDHLAAIRFNAASIMHVEEEVILGRLPDTLLDLPFYDDLPEFHPYAVAVDTDHDPQYDEPFAGENPYTEVVYDIDIPF